MKSVTAGSSMYTISVHTTPNSEGSRIEIQVMVKNKFSQIQNVLLLFQTVSGNKSYTIKLILW